MDKFISLLESLIWPIFIIVILFCYRKYILKVFNSLINRIDSGSEIQAGPFSVGPVFMPNENIDTNKTKKILKELNKDKKSKSSLEELKNYFYIIHTDKVNYKESIKKGYYYFKLNIWIGTDYEILFDKIDKVIYHLHPSFKNSDREIIEKSNKYLLETYARGQFNLIADIYLKGLPDPIRLSRYINLNQPKKNTIACR